MPGEGLKMPHGMLVLSIARGASVLRVCVATNARRGKNAAAISPVALETVKRIDALFDIERDINGRKAE